MNAQEMDQGHSEPLSANGGPLGNGSSNAATGHFSETLGPAGLTGIWPAACRQPNHLEQVAAWEDGSLGYMPLRAPGAFPP